MLSDSPSIRLSRPHGKETRLDWDMLKTETQGIYTRKAEFWHSVRSRTGYENIWLDRFANGLPCGAHVLDLACGTGDPIAAYFFARGYRITGVDYAPTMIDIARQTFPDGIWVLADITDLPDLEKFDGILSWDGFFHLSISEQRAALPKYVQCLKPGGALLLTVGTDEGQVTGYIDTETVYHASLSPEEYEEILKKAGFAQVTFKAEDPECLGRSVLLATGLKAS